MTPERAQILGLEALGWIVGDAEALARFLAASGLAGADLRSVADRPETGAAAIEFLLSDEVLMQRFCEDTSGDSRALHLARHRLEQG